MSARVGQNKDDTFQAQDARAGHKGDATPGASARAGQSLDDAPDSDARAGHPGSEDHSALARAGQVSADAQSPDARAGQASNDTHRWPARADDYLLRSIVTLGEQLDDLMEQRKANGNRIWAMERDFGMALPHLSELQAGLKALEHETALELVKLWRKHPLAAWAKSQRGLGEKSVARLVSLIALRGPASPYEWAPLDAPNPGKLLQYCGHGDPNRSRPRAGASQAEVLACGNPKAKSATWRIAEACMKAKDNPYRDVYDRAREKYLTRIHEGPCVRCGPAGHPAEPGSPWSLAHQHAAALRLVGKRFLIDLWREARAMAETEPIAGAPAPAPETA